MTDAELLESYRATRDRAVLDSLFARHYPTVYHVVLKMVRNATDANDITQSAFLKALEAADTVRPTGSLRNWLLAIAVNEVRQFRRSAARRNRPERLQELARQKDPVRGQEGELQRREFEEHLEQALQQFPDELKDPLVLHYYQNLSYSEMAEVLAIPKSTVQSRMDQALEKLREQFKKRGAVALFAAFLPRRPVLLGLTAMKLKILATSLILLCCLLPFSALVLKSTRAARPEAPETASRTALPKGAAPQAAAVGVSDGAAIFGLVLEKGTDAPIAGALVAVHNLEEGRTDQATTDATGAFRIASTLGSAATHQVRITHPDFSPRSEPAQEASPQPRVYYLSAGGTITGRVKDEQGIPQFPFRIAVVRNRHQGRGYDPASSLYQLALPGEWVLDEHPTTYSPDGRFEIRHVAAGEMILLVSMEGAYPFEGPAKFSVPDEFPVKVQEGKTTDILVIRPHPGTVRVRVLDAETREPIPGAAVQTVAGVGRHDFTLGSKPTLTDDAGQCVVPASLYMGERLHSTRLTIRKPGYSSRRLDFGGQENGYGVEVLLGRPAALRGRIQRPDGTPVERAAIYVESPDDGAVAARAFTDAAGAYSIDFLNAPLAYEVHAFDRSLKDSLGTARIVLREGETRELNFGAAGQAGIRGTVLSQGTPVAAVAVYMVLEPDRGERVAVYTNSRGEFRVEALPPGTYAVTAVLPGEVRKTRRVTVPEGTFAEVRFDAGGFRISGVVRDAATLQPVARQDSVEILARRIDGGDFAESLATYVGDNGAFEFQPAQAGIYELMIGESYQYADGPPVQVDLTSRSQADDVRMVVRKDPQAGTIVLRVVDSATGEPVREGEFRYDRRNLYGMGGFEDGVVEERKAREGRYTYRLYSGVHVASTVTVEIGPDRRTVDQTIKLVRADAVRVGTVQPGGGAEKAGLRDGDLIVSYDGGPIRNIDELQARTGRAAVTQKVPVEVRRGGETRLLLVPGGDLGIKVENTLRGIH
jgi:RNA polymerase sigma-70 factor, ECF subfamily